MNAPPLLQVSVSTLVEAEDAVADLVEGIFHQSPVLVTDEDTLVTRVSVYCRSPREWSPARRTRLLRGLRRVRASGLCVGPGRVSVRTIPAEDWAESWKRHFKPLEVGAALLIKPSWSRRQPKPGQAVVVLDPGLSFGTGQHPTTAFCLEQVVAAHRLGQPPSFLDLGTGSGILAIAAAKLGYRPIRALDIDASAIRVARENAAANGVRHAVKFERADLCHLPQSSATRYHLVGANLLAGLLERQRDRIINRLLPGGRLVLAGVLVSQFPGVQAAYERAGLKLIRRAADKEWQSGVFAWPT